MRLDLALLLLRLGAGGMMLVHGSGKLTDFTATAAWFDQVRPLGLPGTPAALLAVLSELGCSLLLVAGLFTRLAALPLIVTMAVAAFQVQRGEGFTGMEQALLYLCAFAALALSGAGRYSIDGRWRR